MGIAHQIKNAYPGAFKVYQERCRADGEALIGQCLFIPPQPADYEIHDRTHVVYSHRRWIACLFTSKGYGKPNKSRKNPGKDKPDQILQSTRTALQDFRKQLEAFGPTNFDLEEAWKTDDEKPGKILTVKFNSGAFCVPWELTMAIIQQVFCDFERPWALYDATMVPEPDVGRQTWHSQNSQAD